jgi:hypothetical protein
MECLKPLYREGLLVSKHPSCGSAVLRQNCFGDCSSKWCLQAELHCSNCRYDIPPAAIDHHVSDILAFLLGKPAVQSALQQLAQAGAVDGVRCLQDVLWIFSSSVNHRRWLQQLQQQQQEEVQQKMRKPDNGAQKQQQEQVGMMAGARDEEIVRLASGEACGLERGRMEWKMLQQELEAQQAQEQQLLKVWSVVAPLAVRYAEDSISRRFGLG